MSKMWCAQFYVCARYYALPTETNSLADNITYPSEGYYLKKVLDGLDNALAVDELLGAHAGNTEHSQATVLKLLSLCVLWVDVASEAARNEDVVRRRFQMLCCSTY